MQKLCKLCDRQIPVGQEARHAKNVHRTSTEDIFYQSNVREYENEHHVNHADAADVVTNGRMVMDRQVSSFINHWNFIKAYASELLLGFLEILPAMLLWIVIIVVICQLIIHHKDVWSHIQNAYQFVFGSLIELIKEAWHTIKPAQRNKLDDGKSSNEKEIKPQEISMQPPLDNYLSTEIDRIFADLAVVTSQCLDENGLLFYSQQIPIIITFWKTLISVKYRTQDDARTIKGYFDDMNQRVQFCIANLRSKCGQDKVAVLNEFKQCKLKKEIA